MTEIKKRAMLVSLNISIWTARTYDRKVSKDVAAQHKTVIDVGRYNKKLLNDAASYDTITKLGGEIRKWHYENTLPWSQDGSRILPAMNFFDYTDQLRIYREKFQGAVGDFVNEYPALKQRAQVWLNGLYNEADYPQESRIIESFSIKSDIFPLPAAEDFRVDIGDAEVAQIQQRIEEQVQAAQVVAMRDLWERLHSAVSHMVERLSDPDKVFRDTLISNVRELCALLPRLNLTGDAALEQSRRQVESALAVHDPAALREDKVLRASVADQAAKIQSVMAAYMGGPANEKCA